MLRDSYFFTGFCYKPGTDYNESGEEYCEKCFEWDSETDEQSDYLQRWPSAFGTDNWS